MKKLIYPLLTLSILFTIGCDDDKKEESVDSIIGTWTLSAVCGFEDGNCSGTCTDVTAMWLEDEGSFSMTFSSLSDMKSLIVILIAYNGECSHRTDFCEMLLSVGKSRYGCAT